jgi:hypothetical protein
MHASIAASDSQQTKPVTALPALPRVLSVTCGLATIAASGALAAQSGELLGLPAHLGSGALAVVLTLAGLYAASLWRGARRTVHWLEQIPRPSDAPRRRARDAARHRRQLANRLGVLATLRAEFHAVASANPTRRLEDKTAFLRRMATRCLVAAVLLIGVATALLLGA